MDEHPFEASLIIPLFNRAEYTAACLASIAEHTDPALYEVVLVDNGSTDTTGDLLSALDGDVQIVRNEKNLGFARTCNQGAETALGNHLIFVNNDVVTLPGWLEPLLEVLEAEDDVAIVGARLLFPDGLVQHGGMRTWEKPDGSIGASLHPYKVDPELAGRRAELDVVAGAVMAVRRSFFEQEGGFCCDYWNGHEDVDLCLTARSQGLRVVYEPRSTLIHHESGSGPERFSHVTQNSRLLTERWAGRYIPELVTDDAWQAYPNPRRQDGGLVDAPSWSGGVTGTTVRAGASPR
ncbi:MAG: glycosyltransferase family 2 protein [Micrococcales bacterium]|nr:glycosyltransferase family 2 protein [Micrococcales bacterium]